MDIKNDYFDKDGLEDMVCEIIIEHDEDEDVDRHLIDMALQLSQQSEGNNRAKYNYKLSTELERYDRKHGPQFPNHSNSSYQNTSTIHLSNLQCSVTINCLAVPDNSPSMQQEMLPDNSSA